MATYVLVHGAWHGAWCWERVVPQLERAGHRVQTVDLPGHGANPASVSEMTLENYAQAVVDAIDATEGPVVLVAHSMGGLPSTQAAERVPERVAKIVYVSAFLPGDGQSLVQLADGDPEGHVLPNLIVDEATGLCTVATDALHSVFYGSCSEADAAWASAQLVPESLAAQTAPVSITEERAGAVPRFYIECTGDRAIGIGKQRQMWAARPCERVITLDADHSPFLSTTQALATELLALA